MSLPIQFTSVPIKLLHVVAIRTPDSFAAPLAGFVTGKFAEPLLVLWIILLLL